MFDRFFAVCPTSGRSGSDSYCVRNSADPWTSQARPTFLYLIYLVILLLRCRGSHRYLVAGSHRDRGE